MGANDPGKALSALLLSALIIVSTVAMGAVVAPAGATGGANTLNNGTDATALSDEEVEIHTQSGDNVEIASRLQSELQTTDQGETIEVFVQLDASRSEALESAYGADTDPSTLSPRERANVTQRPLELFAAGQSGLEIKTDFWITNAVLVELNTSQLSPQDLTTVDGVDRLQANFEIENPREQVETASFSPGNEIANGRNTTYGLAQINAPETWGELGTRGEGTTVAIVDTGVNPDHEAFPGYNESNWAAFGFDGSPLHTDTQEFADPFDDNGHGTHVAGTAVGGNASGTAIGVAPEAELYAINVFPDPQGATTLAAIVAGLQHAVEQDVDVANFSLGGGGFADIYIDVVRTAQEKGMHVVSAAGNDGPDATGTPGNIYDNTAVGASDVDEQIASFSTGDTIDTSEDWGPIAPDDWPASYVTPDVSAPGVTVLSADWRSTDGYRTLQGTSMASPHVTGVTALIQSANSSVAPSEIKTLLEETARKPAPDEISQSVLRDAQSVSVRQVRQVHFDDRRDVRYGYGIVDAYSAVSAVTSGTQTIDGTVTNDAGNAVVDQALSRPTGVLPDGSGATVTIDDADREEYVLDGEEEGFAFEVTEGQYDLSVTGAFGHEDKTIEDVSAGSTVDATLNRTLEVQPQQLQPGRVESGNAFEIGVNVAHLENLTVELADSATVSGSDVTVNVTDRLGNVLYGDVLGTTVQLSEPTTLYPAVLNVSVDSSVAEGEVVALEHTFEGLGESENVSTGPTEVVGTIPDVQPVRISENNLFESVRPLDPLDPGTVTIENPDPEVTQTVTAVWETNRFGALGQAQFTLAPNETVTYDPGLTGFQWLPNWQPGERATNTITVVNDNGVDTVSQQTLINGAEVSGTVTDVDTGDPLPGMEVRLIGPSGQVQDSTVTNGTGQYSLVGIRSGDHQVVAQTPGFGPNTETVTFNSNLDPVSQDVEVGSDPAIELEFTAGESYAIGIPGPIEGGTVGDVLPDVQGQAFVYDKQANDWVVPDLDDPVEPMDALVFIPLENVTTTVELAGVPGETGTVTPETAPISNGLNFVAPTQFGPPEKAFSTTADPVSVVAIQNEPNSQMLPKGGFDGFASVGSATEDVNPFSGYFVFADADSGDQLQSALYEGITLDQTYENLNISARRVSGNVVSDVDGAGVVDATLNVSDLPFATSTAGNTIPGAVDVVGSDGAFSLPPLPAAVENEITVSAEGFQQRVVTDGGVAADDTVNLTEETAVTVVNDEVTVTPNTDLSPGDSVTIEYTVKNVGSQTGKAEVNTGIGDTASLNAIRLRQGAFGVESQLVELAPGETKDISVTTEVPQALAGTTGGQLEIGVFTNRDEVIETAEVNVSASISFTEQATASTTITKDDPTTPAVVAENVESNVDSAIVVTYSNGSDLEIAGLTTATANELNVADVTVPITNPAGFPGNHTAHVIPIDLVSDRTLASGNVSTATAGAVADQQQATVYQGTVDLTDQTVTGSANSVTVETANLTGESTDPSFSVVIHEADANGGIGNAVGNASLSGSNSAVTVDLNTQLTENQTIYAMLHVDDGGQPGSPIPNADAESGFIGGNVVDDAELTVERPT